MSNEKKDQEKEVLWIRFKGKSLDNKSIPIYELGKVLISIQQIIHKAYLYRTKRLDKNSLTKKERQQLALQIYSHQKGSDVYGVIPFETMPPGHTLASLAEESLQALEPYTKKEVIAKLEDGNGKQNQMYIASIFTQVHDIVKRVDKVSGIRDIEIYQNHDSEKAPIITMDENTRKYVNQLRHEDFEGEHMEIKGKVTRLYVEDNIVLVRTPSKNKVKVFLKIPDFEYIRFETGRETNVTFKGKPKYRLGMETPRIERFDAYEVEFEKT